MAICNDVLQKIKSTNINFIDLRFTDVKGKLHHITVDKHLFETEIITEGLMFDASSIEGWKAINDSDMLLMPDLCTEHIDPFFTESTLNVLCDVVDPIFKKPYNRDPRSIAKNAEKCLQSLHFADTVYIGPEAEFFIFDNVTYQVDPYKNFFSIDSIEFPINNNKTYASGNLGHRPRLKGGYVPVPPIDAGQDMRSEMLIFLKKMGVSVEKHHHEVAPGQHELGLKFDTLTKSADQLQIYKYVVQQVANSYGKTATFMPKPIVGDNGSGMHVHISLWKNGHPIFAGNEYAGLSQDCLYFIGGIIHHAKALNAFTNPSINSYKRLVAGYEAPVLLAYSMANRSAACRIPFTVSFNAKRIEIRFPDPSANPYLAFSALLMAGIDGIRNKISPGNSIDKDLYSLCEKELKKIPKVCGSLQEAIDALDRDREFLKYGGVFNDDYIDSFIAIKIDELLRFNSIPHPIEFDMYYSV